MPTKPPTKIKYSSQEIDNLTFDEDFGTKIIESAGFDGVNLQRLNASNLNLRLQYDASNNPIYLGLAAPGSLETEAKWQIRYLTFDVNNNVTGMSYANGTPNFDKKWSARSTDYVYS